MKVIYHNKSFKFLSYFKILDYLEIVITILFDFIKSYRINGQSERPAEGLDMDDERQRALAFNLSFILLTRIRFIYDDLVSNFCFALSVRKNSHI